MTELLRRFIGRVKRLFAAAVRKGDPPHDGACEDAQRPLPPSPSGADAGGGPGDG
jgi:hypothetical protein